MSVGISKTTRSNEEVNRAIAEALEPLSSGWLDIFSPLKLWTAVNDYWDTEGFTLEQLWNPLPFSTDYNAAHAAWARLTEEQKFSVVEMVTVQTPWSQRNCMMGMQKALDATPRQLCDWILAVVEGAER